jgi:COP9 signalosome complex subunit 2
LTEFLGIPSLEPEKGEWGFKSLKQAIKLEISLGQFDKVGPRCVLVGGIF